MIDAADGNAVYYYHFDGLGSVGALSNTSGSIVETYSYDAFGNTTVTLDGSTANPYTFTGRRLDVLDGDDLKLMYYRNRTYDTETGRFMQTDMLGINPAGGKDNPFFVPKQYTDGMNLYNGYFAMRMKLDPTGTMSLGDVGALAGKIGKGARGALLPIKIVACASCGLGTLGIQAMCAANPCLDFEDCLCELMDSSAAWKAACNVCLSPISWFADVKKFFGCGSFYNPSPGPKGEIPRGAPGRMW